MVFCIFSSDIAPYYFSFNINLSISLSFYERLPTITSIFMLKSYILPIIHGVSRYLRLSNCMILEKQSIFHIFIAFISTFSHMLFQVTTISCCIFVHNLPFKFENPHIF